MFCVNKNLKLQSQILSPCLSINSDVRRTVISGQKPDPDLTCQEKKKKNSKQSSVELIELSGSGNWQSSVEVVIAEQGISTTNQICLLVALFLPKIASMWKKSSIIMKQPCQYILPSMPRVSNGTRQQPEKCTYVCIQVCAHLMLMCTHVAIISSA